MQEQLADDHGTTPLAVVTGGAGFIGSALSHRLIGQGYTVIALDSLHPQIHPNRSRPAELHPEVELIVGDVTDPLVWDELLSRVRPELVVHLAAETGTGQSLDEATRHSQVNVVGTTVMTDALLRHNTIPAQIILASSRAVYGEGQWESASGEFFYPAPRSHEQLARAQWDCTPSSGEPSHGVPSRAGSTAAQPTSVYGATKLAQENILRSWCLATGTALSILRLQNVYGPGQSVTNSYTGIVVLFTRLAAAGSDDPACTRTAPWSVISSTSTTSPMRWPRPPRRRPGTPGSGCWTSGWGSPRPSPTWPARSPGRPAPRLPR